MIEICGEDPGSDLSDLAFQMRRNFMLHPSSRSRFFVVTVLILLAGMIEILFPGISVHAATKFTLQARLGFAAGDDWESAMTADHYGHVYVLYKHYDVAGQTTCSSCALHVLLQVSGDRGQTWSFPRPIDPEPVVGGQYASQMLFVQVDGMTVWSTFLKNIKSSIQVMNSTDFATP